MYQGWATERGRPDRRTYVCRSRVRGRRCEAPTCVTADAVDKYAETEFLGRVGGLASQDRSGGRGRRPSPRNRRARASPGPTGDRPLRTRPLHG
ncbi:hypothetical protein ABZW44_07215 [Streptomyces mirabilis]|uniref:hypothetical protein n=1 Tax=Streptomyces mirabilis TaxID=68239 RepID=UPI00339F3BEF